MQHLDCRLVNPSAGKSHPLLVHHVHSADGRGLLVAVTASDPACNLSRLPAKQRIALRQHLLGVRRRESYDALVCPSHFLAPPEQSSLLSQL